MEERTFDEKTKLVLDGLLLVFVHAVMLHAQSVLPSFRCVCVCVCVSVYIYTYMCTHTHVDNYICIHIHIPTCIHICRHAASGARQGGSCRAERAHRRQAHRIDMRSSKPRTDCCRLSCRWVLAVNTRTCKGRGRSSGLGRQHLELAHHRALASWLRLPSAPARRGSSNAPATGDARFQAQPGSTCR